MIINMIRWNGSGQAAVVPRLWGSGPSLCEEINGVPLTDFANFGSESSSIFRAAVSHNPLR